MALTRNAVIAATLFATLQTGHAETVLNKTHQQDLSLTVYQNGLAFVRDQRRIDLAKGPQDIVFEDISAQAIPDSLLIAGKGFTIQERRFDFEVLNPSLLLQKSVGKTVAFSRFNSVTGKDEMITAKILTAQGEVIIERDGKIEVGQPGRLVVEKLPDGLRLKPALMAAFDVEKNGPTDLALAYLSNGLQWNTSYSMELANDGKSLTLNAWANLTNTSGTDYKNASLAVAAGSINRQSAPQPIRMMAKGAPRLEAMAMDSAVEHVAMAPQSVGGMHLYELPGKLDLNHQETKQVALMKPQTFISERILTQTFRPYYTAMPRQNDTPVHPNIEISFTNSSGQPLPDGLVRLYRQDKKATLQFVGEDRLNQTPDGVKAKIHPGQSFDVTLTHSQTDYEITDKNQFEASYKVVIKNAKSTPETVRVEERFPGQWQLEEASHKTTERAGQSAVWKIDVGAGADETLTYRVSVKTR